MPAPIKLIAVLLAYALLAAGRGPFLRGFEVRLVRRGDDLALVEIPFGQD